MSEIELKDGSGPEVPPGPEVPEEQQLGGTPKGKAANDALRALSRSARAFALYDPGNEAIRNFLEDYRARMDAALAATGGLEFEVRPFELVLAGEVVYLERDRERSLAFRLFRDGVRRLVIPAGVAFDELLRLLEVLSVRFAGVRQQEDDVVTLLTKAAFRQISFEAVEGFVANDDEDPDGSEFGGGRLLAVEHVTAPVDFDLPYPQPLQPRAFAYRAVPPQLLERLQAEETPDTVPARAVRMVGELLAAATDPASGATLAETAPTIAGVRDFLVADRRLGALVEFVTALRAAAAREPATIGSLFSALGTEDTLARLLQVARADDAAGLENLGKLLELVPGDHLSHVVALLGASSVNDDEPRRAVLRRLLVRRARLDSNLILARLKAAEPAQARELLTALLEAVPARALEAARELAESPDPDLQLAVIDILARAPPGEEAARQLAKHLGSPVEEVRIRAISVLVERKELRAFDLIAKDIQRRAAELGEVEATAMGEGLARLLPTTALPLFAGWVRAKAGLLKRLGENQAQRTQQWVAVAGLSLIPGDEPEKLIKEVSARAGTDEGLKKHCVAAMIRRRKEGRSRG